MGRDLVVVSVDGDVAAARHTVSDVRGVEQVDVSGQVLTARVSDGAGTVSPIAVALSGADGVEVTELSLRRPTLDDVFLSVTGEQISAEEDAAIGADDKAGVPA
ncbi:MAG: DUF4162 domain-containing protein [Ornithinimicrobium sp.]|uniref:ATP-binding protein DrrA1-3 family domain-containing protein n=1 Tax=Ornithinimicrobium sp. TaxID=1977084 RepID=UPI003D9AC18C